MAELKIYITADTKGAQHSINQVTESVESLRKQYIKGKTSAEDYTQSLNNQIAVNNELLSPLKALEANTKLLHTELSRLSLSFNENNGVVKEVAAAYSKIQDELKKYKEELATVNQQTQEREMKAQLEAEQKAIEDTRKYYKALGDSMGYAQNEANILANALKKTISVGGTDEQIQDAANAYLKQKDAIAEVSRQEELYLAQVQNAINQEKARAQAIEDSNNSSLESWKRFTKFVEQQQAKINALNAGTNPTESSMKMGNYSSSNANMAYYKAIGDEVGYAREEVTLYGNEVKRLISLEGDHSSEISRAVESYKNAQTNLDKLSKSASSFQPKILEITKNILKFQLIMGPIRKAISAVTQTISSSIEVAAEAEQIFSKLSTVFAGLEDSASSTANVLASTIGVAKSSAASALSTVGDMLQAQGMGTAESLKTAKEWVEQFQDIIAFKDINMDLAEFATNFMSGATGNLRNFRTFGSIVKESAVQAKLAEKGLDGLSDSQLELEKMVIRANMALEQQANAIGATNREWDTTQSITRRYTEQTKALMEYIGDAINTKLNPLKSWWADIAEQINKAHDAQAQFNAGQKNISVYDISSNTDDYKSFKQTIQSEFINPSRYSSVTGQPGYVDSTAKQLVELMTKYNATSEDVLSVWTEMPNTIQQSLLAQEEQLKKEKEQERLLTQLKEDWTSISESAIDFVSQLDSINGASTGKPGNVVYNSVNRTAPLSENKMDDMKKSLELATSAAISNAINSFKASDWTNFVSSLDIAFGTATESEGLEEKIKELQSLYSLINAQALKDGEVTETEKKQLEDILSIYDAILRRQQAITDEAERQVEVQSLKTTFLDSASSYNSQAEQIDMSDSDKALYQLLTQYNEAMAVIGLTTDEQKELTDAYNEASKALVKLIAKQKESTEKTEEQAKIDDINKQTEEYQKQLRQLNMTDSEKVLDDLQTLYNESSDEAKDAVAKQIEAYKELTAATNLKASKDAVFGAFGETGSTVKTITDWSVADWNQVYETYQNRDLKGFASSTIGSDVISMLAQFASQLEVVQKISSAISDILVPVIDAFLKPLSDILDNIISSTQDLLVQILNPMFKVLRAILVPLDEVLSVVFELASELVDVFLGPVEDILIALLPILTTGITVVTSLLQVISPLIKLVGQLIQFLTPLVQTILTPIINMITGIFKLLITGFTYIEVFFKKVVGNIGLAFMNVWNSVVSVLRSINIFGWSPFEGMRYSDTSTMSQWTQLDYQEEVAKKLEMLNATTQDIQDTNLAIEKNTESDDSFAVLEDLLKSNIINLDQYNAGLRVAQKDMVFDTVTPVDYVATSSTPSTTVQYGNVSLTINGGNIDETQRVVIRLLRQAGYDVSSVPITA